MKYKKTVLKNGLRVITIPMQESETAIGMVLVEAGSDYESKSLNGISHFLEHMCFKGTKNRTGDEIKLEIDSLGSDSNAFTGEEYTGYYAKARHEEISKIIDLISDMYLYPTFPEKDIDIERGVIIEEMNMYEDYPNHKVWEVFEDLLYKNQPAGRRILGPKENIQKFKKSDFINYHDLHYVPGKTVVVVAGKINEQKVLKEINDRFAKLPKGKIATKTKTKESQKKPVVSIFEKPIDQTHLILGFRGFDLYDKKLSALKLGSAVLGAGFSSRLFNRMRDELGICYYVRSSAQSNTDRGIFAVSAGVSNARFHEAVTVIIEEFRKLRDIKIDEKELEKAKKIILGNLATRLETSDAWAFFYGDQELSHQKIKTPEDKAKEIKKITSADIAKVMKEVISNARLNLAVVGPQKNDASLQKLLKV